MKQQGYGEFSLEFQQRLWAYKVPLNGSIEVTRRCPLECAHCYNNLPMGDQEARRGELTYEEHCRLLDEITEAGCLWLLYSGGEIFARQDFLSIYTYAKKKGLFITLFTNGTQITPKIADHLAHWRPFSIEITLYGRTRETYERLTGIPGSYDRCMRGIQLLMERGLPLSLKTVGVTINKHEIGDMKRFAEEELGLPFKFDSMINARIDCSQSPLAVRLTPEDVVGQDVQDPKRADEWRTFYEQARRLKYDPQGREDVYHCGGGMSAFAIDPQGKMSICVLSHMDMYDLRTGSFQEGWERFLSNVRRKKITRVTKCTACGMRSMCASCPATAELEQGDPEEPVDFFCHTTHLRAYALDLPVPPHGDCAYCEGGSRYHEVVKSAAALKAGERASGAANWIPGSPLPIVSEATAATTGGCSSGGCTSCGLAAVHGRQG
ncbi:radical SAM protein [Nitrospiraceae bacterium AH_259_D15_M11_P09]|nr:radical SAM protein [Nitrospiraceae bacterium AH_259_D15_M11_P09]